MPHTRRRALLAHVVAIVGVSAALMVGSAASASAASSASAAAGRICVAPRPHARLASRLSAGIRAAVAGRAGTIAVAVYDRRTRLMCRLNEGHRFDSASVVKATILAALLRWHRLTASDRSLAYAMITRSDNDAASALWAEVGHARLRHFLALARMTETSPDPDGYWGLTQITARDELTLLRLLTRPNRVLNTSSRRYELRLMSRVIGAQRWGVPAGAPSAVTVHVKNGWLPLASGGWRVHSIGSFSGHGRDYMIVVLTDGNPTMGYGVDTIERIAETIHHDLNAGLPRSRQLAPVLVPAILQVPDEPVPPAAVPSA